MSSPSNWKPPARSSEPRVPRGTRIIRSQGTRPIVRATSDSFGVPQRMSPSVFCVTRVRGCSHRAMSAIAAGRPTLAIWAVVAGVSAVADLFHVERKFRGQRCRLTGTRRPWGVGPEPRQLIQIRHRWLLLFHVERAIHSTSPFRVPDRTCDGLHVVGHGVGTGQLRCPQRQGEARVIRRTHPSLFEALDRTPPQSRHHHAPASPRPSASRRARRDRVVPATAVADRTAAGSRRAGLSDRSLSVCQKRAR